MTLPDHTRVAIIGAGFSGLCMAIRLMQEGIDDFVVLERGEEVGGTWRDNTYPGCQCDIPSALYSLSFAPNPDWTRLYPLQEEIRDYLQGVAADFGVMPYIRLGHAATDAAWDDDANRWQLQTSEGDLTADVLVGGMGGLTEPSIPEIPGLESFEGTLFHSARWNHDHDLSGERVAAIGTGASAIQFVPMIQPQVGKLHLFQRTPSWVMPDADRSLSAFERRMFRRVPATQRMLRAGLYLLHEMTVFGTIVDRRLSKGLQMIARRHLEKQVEDPELREKLMPDYIIGCKRITMSNTYYPALTQPNAEVVTEPIREIRAHSIVTEDGVERELDTIILATGFHVHDNPGMSRIRGRDGRSMARDLGGEPARLHGLDGRRLPEPVPARRPEQRRRLQLDHLHHRGARQLRRRGDQGDGPGGTGRGGGPSRGLRRVQPQGREDAHRKRLERRRLLELVPRLQRPQRGLVARVHMAAVAADAALRARGLRGAARPRPRLGRPWRRSSFSGDSICDHPSAVGGRSQGHGRSCLVPLALLAALALPSAAAAYPAVGVTDLAGDSLVSLDTANPASFTSVRPISGLAAGERIVGIDYRNAPDPVNAPGATPRLFALAVDGNGTGTNARLYTVDPGTGAATAVGAGAFSFSTASPAHAFGFDFNPRVDRIRAVNASDENMRANPNNGGRADFPANDTDLNPAGQQVSAIAYDRVSETFLGVPNTSTVYGINPVTDMLVTVGGINGSPSPNGGGVFGIGGLTVNAASGASINLDIALDGTAYATMTVGGNSGLYTVNLTSGAATLIANMANPLRAFAVVPDSSVQFSAEALTQAEGGTATVTVTRTGSLASTQTVGYETTAGTASGDNDFTPVSGRLSFAPDEAEKSFELPTTADSVDEPDETVGVQLTSPDALISARLALQRHLDHHRWRHDSPEGEAEGVQEETDARRVPEGAEAEADPR